jgi:hypothetical protein
MQLRFSWKMTWSAAVVAITVFNVVAVWFKGTLPFEIVRFDSRSMTVAPRPDLDFPKGLVPGEQIDFPSQDSAMRAAISANSEGNLVRGVTYNLVVQRLQGEAHIPVTTMAVPLDATIAIGHAEQMLADLLLGAMTLLLLWRGEGRAALSLALYCTWWSRTVRMSTSGQMRKNCSRRWPKRWALPGASCAPATTRL